LSLAIFADMFLRKPAKVADKIRYWRWPINETNRQDKILAGKLFHNLGAAAENDLSPSVGRQAFFP